MRRNRLLNCLITFFIVLFFSVSCAKKIPEAEVLANAHIKFDEGKYRAAFIDLKNLLQANSSNVQARILLGKTAIKLGDPSAASKEFSRARELGASDDEVYVLQLESLLMLNEAQKLADEFDTSGIESEENRTQARLHYGSALLALGEIDSAEREFQNAVDLNQSSRLASDGYIGLANVLRSKGNIEAAKQQTIKAHEMDVQSPTPIIALGQIYLSTKEFDKARAEFEKEQQFSMLSNNQQFMFASGRVESNIGLGNIEEAKRASNDLFKVAPEHPITGYLLARVAYLGDDKEMAYDGIQKVLAKYPEFRPAQLLKGALSLERKEFQQAEMFLSSVVASQPSNVEARKLLAEAQLQQNKAEEAAAMLKQAIAIGAQDAEVNNLMSRINLRLNDAENNIAYLEEALEKDPENDQLKISLAAAYLGKGQVDRAAALVEAISPDAIEEAHRGLMRFLVAAREDDLVRAQEIADTLTQRWPDDARINSVISGWYVAKGRLDDARVIYERMAKNDPTNSEPVISLARLDVRQNRIAQAKSLLEDFLANNSTQKNINVWMSLSFLQRRDGDAEGAIKTLEQLYESNQDSELVAVVLARSLIVEKRFDQAARVLDQATNMHPKSANIRLHKGQIFMQQGQFLEGLKEFDFALAQRPSSPRLLKNKARAESALKRYAQAIVTLRKLMELTPSDFQSAKHLAVLETKAGNTAAADTVIFSLRRHNPDDPRVDEIEGDLKMLKEDPSGAFESYSKAYKKNPSRSLSVKLSQLAEDEGSESTGYLKQWLAKSPDDTSVRLMLAQQLQKLGRNDEALSEYESVLSVAPENSLALNNLAWLYYEGSGPGFGSDAKIKAISLAKRAYTLSPESEQIADTYGWLLFRSGEIDGGLELLKKAEKMARDGASPALFDIGYHYAVALNESGDKTQARSVLQRILQRDDDFANREDAEVLLSTLNR